MGFFGSYFQFTRSERNGIFVLIIILFIVIISPFILDQFIPEVRTDYSDLEAKIDSLYQPSSAIEHDEKADRPEKFTFDPNTVSANQLELLGFNQYQSRNLLKYRKSGGQFFEKEDLLKIYGVDSLFYHEIESYVYIEKHEIDKPQKRESVFNEQSSIAEKKPMQEVIDSSINNVLPDQAYATYVNINIADSVEITNIIRNNPELVKRIISYRDLLGGFYALEQINEVYGIKKYMPYIEDRIEIDTTSIVKINLNQVSFKDLNKHPYISYDETKAVFSYRKIMGSFSNAEQLLQNNLVSKETYQKMKPYLITQNP